MKTITYTSAIILSLMFAYFSAKSSDSSELKHLAFEKAPEIKAEKWINSDALTLSSLKGKVVLIEFWAFACYNCKNTIPKMKEWYSKYKGDKFEIIGIHCPEFDNERDFENVKEKVKEYGIEYPVAIDNAFHNWYNYDVHAWPTIFLVDKNGEIRYSKVGEGGYKKTEELINELLKE